MSTITTTTTTNVQNVSVEVFEKVAALVSDKSIRPVRTSSTAEKCRFYGLYKRATVGKLLPPYTDDDIDVENRPKSRPGIFSFEARSKYDGWTEADKLATKQEARDEYVKLACEVVGEPVLKVLQEQGS